ncbi:MAG: hypothetical protein ACK5LK_04160 [Chthoniobacterales bacterium]
MFQRKFIYRLCFLATGVIVALNLGACKSVAPLSPEEAPAYVTVMGHSPFYQIGPQQTNGPDMLLPGGTLVRVLRERTGYCYVSLPDTRRGYVAKENLIPASEAQLLQEQMRNEAARYAQTGGGSGGGRSSSADDEAYYPLPPMPSEPLPDLDVGPEEFLPPTLIDDVDETSEKPKFRL